VPEDVLPRPRGAFEEPGDHELEFNYIDEPFSFSVKRAGSNEILFDSSAASLIFESQYVRLRTHLPDTPSLYGLGEHTDPFMLNTTNYTRTIWNRDAYGVPPGTNLYGDHPVYYDHRGSDGTHGVFLLNSNGMDVKINDTDGTYLEYNILGGVLDFYFLAGPTPVQVAKQYAKVVGHSAMMPYWGFGYHHCRYGMRVSTFLKQHGLGKSNLTCVGCLRSGKCRVQLLRRRHTSGNDVDRHRLHVPSPSFYIGS
jgi:alpha-glucosidase